MAVTENNAHITTDHYEVAGTSDEENNQWKVVKGVEKASDDRLEAVYATFYLYNERNKCFLRRASRLPKWGFEQGEVTCDPHVNINNVTSNFKWIVSTNDHQNGRNI